MAWPYEKPKVPDPVGIPRRRIAASRERALARRKKSTPPFDFCEFCGSRDAVFYDTELLKHACSSCWMDTERPKPVKVTTSQPEPADEPELE